MPGIRESEQETRDGSGAAVRAVKTAAPVLGEVSRAGREEVSGCLRTETGGRRAEQDKDREPSAPLTHEHRGSPLANCAGSRGGERWGRGGCRAVRGQC